jgi:hypothetical protein
MKSLSSSFSSSYNLIKNKQRERHVITHFYLFYGCEAKGAELCTRSRLSRSRAEPVDIRSPPALILNKHLMFLSTVKLARIARM